MEYFLSSAVHFFTSGGQSFSSGAHVFSHAAPLFSSVVHLFSSGRFADCYRRIDISETVYKTGPGSSAEPVDSGSTRGPEHRASGVGGPVGDPFGSRRTAMQKATTLRHIVFVLSPNGRGVSSAFLYQSLRTLVGTTRPRTKLF